MKKANNYLCEKLENTEIKDIDLANIKGGWINGFLCLVGGFAHPCAPNPSCPSGCGGARHADLAVSDVFA